MGAFALRQGDQAPLIDGVEVTASAASINSAGSNTGTVVAGSYTADGDDDTAGTLGIATGLSSVTAFFVDVLRSDVKVTADADISESSGTLTVADGAATYAITSGDVIYWMAVGSV
eukprot:NODE_13242_length_436_cov_1.262136_g13219_i0.p1 GENE.NODE_13242_length_436_cov_1.262136_g13219_i0~~NODE_13242_length_436_cov_1.262136_g13219_i0.p1  ORF type:complete len:116 (+),score=19.80 NODE_13242_length_436_cov_1.262136_g13219_i0:84-431(+)